MTLVGTKTSLSRALLLVSLVSTCVRAQIQPPANVSLATRDRVEDAGWWPTKGSAPRTDYADPGACAGCHEGLAALQHTTAMYKASKRPADADVLQRHSTLTFDDGIYSYLLKSGPEGAKFTVRDRTTFESRDVAWAFGEGEIGQTYLLQSGNGYIESRLSYYLTTNALNITIGHHTTVPPTMEQSFGQLLSPQTAQSCFGCHTTMSTISNTFSTESAIPGVTCQACHGPGASHIKAMTEASGYDSRILNPGSLPPAASVDFCGACHRTWIDVTMYMPSHIGMIDVRFQPYRLEKSRCWGTNGDARITCIACHDPHRPLVHDLSTYDKNCLACHTSGAHSGSSKAHIAVCKVSTANCVSCHMPKYVVPEAHAGFTDHDIRVVHPGDPFPE
jgi:hypothetical protein